MWRFDLGTPGNPIELYDARARMWSPKLGTFLSVDEFAFHDARSTLWGWPGQNSIRWRDPTGRIGMGDSASSDRAIGSSQNWGDSSFQTGVNQGAAAGAAPVALYFAPEAAAAMPGFAQVLGLGMFAFAASQVQSSDDVGGHMRLALAVGGLKGLGSASEAAGGVCKATDAMNAVRAACPGGQCDALSRALIAELGEGQLATLFPKGGGPLPTAPGVSSVPWAQHTAVQLPSGVILDPLTNASYPSLSAWRSAVTGTADVGVMIDGAVQ